MKWWDRAVCRWGTSDREVTGVPGQQTPSSQQTQELTSSPAVPPTGNPLSPSMLPTLSLPLPISEHRLSGCYLVQTFPIQMGRLRPGEAGCAKVTQHMADWAGPQTLLSPCDPGSGLQINAVPSSFPSDFPCPPPQTSRNPSSSWIAWAARGHLLHAVSGRGHRPGHYVMIR